MKSNLLMFESKKPIFIIIFYQRMKVSPEARRLSKYKEKKKEFSVATLQFDVTFCTPIPCAPSIHLYCMNCTILITFKYMYVTNKIKTAFL